MQESEHRELWLTSALRAVAEDEARAGASPAVETRLLAEVRSIAHARRRRKYAAVYAVAAALALAVSVAAWRTWSPVRQRPAIARLPSVEPRTGASTGEAATDFLPLIFRSVPISHAQIIRLEVPRTALASFGLASTDSFESSSSGTVLADVVVGEDGLARAVRFVQPATN
jgi:hypothetical protein